MGKNQRQRCLTVGCNPKLNDPGVARVHADETGHRTAAWPKRSAEGQRRAKERNRNGYYDKYNAGATVRRPVIFEETAFGEDDF